MKQKEYSLPNPPADVLALFDLLPPDILEQVQLRMVVYNVEMFAQLRTRQWGGLDLKVKFRL